MILRWLVAAVHLLALGIGLGAILDRAWELRGPQDAATLRRAFQADTLWGVAALLWISTGLWRVLAGLEKPASYYVQNHIFWTKMGLLVVVIALEIVPAMTLARWRRQSARGAALDMDQAPRIARISLIQAGFTVLMVLAATAMARGLGS
jgi:putative membrane protein